MVPASSLPRLDARLGVGEEGRAVPATPLPSLDVMRGVGTRGVVLPTFPPKLDSMLVVWTWRTLPPTESPGLGVPTRGMVCPSKIPKLDAKLGVGKSDNVVLASSAKLDAMLRLVEDCWTEPGYCVVKLDARPGVDKAGRVLPGFTLADGTRGRVVSASPSWLDCRAAADEAVGNSPEAASGEDLVSKPFDSDASGFPPMPSEVGTDLSDWTEDGKDLSSEIVLSDLNPKLVE